MKISRLMSIIMILLEKNRISAQTLANLFEVSIRTIYRDIEAINLAGIPVVATPGVNGGIEILRNYKVDKQVFSAHELSTILTGLSSLNNLVENEHLVNAVIKMRSIIPQEQAAEIESKTEQIRIDSSQWTSFRHLQPQLDTIKKALSERKILSFVYINRYGTKTERQVEPYQIIVKGNQFYFYGYCCCRKDYRLFKLVRILSLELTNDSFAPRDYQKAELESSDYLKSLQRFIKLRIHQSILERVLDYCDYEECLSDGNQHYI